MAHKSKINHPIVIVERDWKEYIGECLLIMFSVVLALVVTEVISDLNEKKKTREILHQLRSEVEENKKIETEQYAYHRQVVTMIDSAIANPLKAYEFISNGRLNLKVIFPPPYVVLLHDLNDVAWQIAKQNNIVSKIDIDTYSLLNDIYNNQQRITNSEDKIAEILLRADSRKPENITTTLNLLHDSYVGWDVQRAPNLLKLYTEAIDKLESY